MLVCSSVCESMYTQVQIPIKYVSMHTQVQILMKVKKRMLDPQSWNDMWLCATCSGY